MEIEEFTHGYIIAALWSSTDGDGNPLDDTHEADDLAEETRQKMEKDCHKFFEECNEDLWIYRDKRALPIDADYTAAECAGHDFWLTRCGHGAGFWDRGIGPVGDRLTDAANKFGNVDLYIGDDGKIYQA
jgi:hypothetical protein